jgi:hypothetical protein
MGRTRDSNGRAPGRGAFRILWPRQAGLPGRSETIPRLPFFRRESRLTRDCGAVRRCTGPRRFRCRQDLLLEQAAQQLRHIATDGLLNPDPDLSGLMLSLVDRQGRPQDGFLRLLYFWYLRFPAELVTLSACQTALGQEIGGEGVPGLTGGFLHAGVARVLSTSWRVDDEAIAESIGAFYAGMFGPQKLSPGALPGGSVEDCRDRALACAVLLGGLLALGELAATAKPSVEKPFPLSDDPYAELRAAVFLLNQSRGSTMPEDHPAEVKVRVLEFAARGVSIEDIPAYGYGIAKHVLAALGGR